jgi:hypothetical protein
MNMYILKLKLWGGSISKGEKLTHSLCRELNVLAP